MTTTKKESRAMQRMHLIRRFYALMREQAYPDTWKETTLTSYGVDSTTKLTNDELEEIVRKAHKRESNIDRQRKRVIAAACAMLTEMESESFFAADADGKIAMAKAVAARAAKVEDFNKIKIDKLRALYGAFRTQTKMIQAVVPAAMEVINGE